MSIPARLWIVIYCPWGVLLLPGLAVAIPSADQVLNHPVVEEEGEYAS